SAPLSSHENSKLNNTGMFSLRHTHILTQPRIKPNQTQADKADNCKRVRVIVAGLESARVRSGELEKNVLFVDELAGRCVVVERVTKQCERCTAVCGLDAVVTD